MKSKNTICLWFNKDAQEAARFYAATFPNSEVTAVHEVPPPEKRVKGLSGIERVARLTLDRVEAAHTLKRSRGIARQSLRGVEGRSQGQYSIRINDQWRICLEWPEKSPGPTNVESVDYH